MAHRPIANPMAPMTSRRPPVASGTCGTTTATSATTRIDSAADTQNSPCQFQASAIQADSGRPMAPPTPRVALIAAIAIDVIRGGVTSRIRLMPTGMKPIASPWMPRPTIIGITVELSAQVTDPTTSSRPQPISTRCLPNISPRRPAIGIETAAASRVAVMTQEAVEREVLSRFGSSG